MTKVIYLTSLTALTFLGCIFFQQVTFLWCVNANESLGILRHVWNDLHLKLMQVKQRIYTLKNFENNATEAPETVSMWLTARPSQQQISLRDYRRLRRGGVRRIIVTRSEIGWSDWLKVCHIPWTCESWAKDK